MAKHYSFSIDLTKIPADKIRKTNKEGKPFKNGGEFVNLTLFINDEEDKVGNDLSLIISGSKNEPTLYVGGGKTKKES